jgi:hypothetical protein
MNANPNPIPPTNIPDTFTPIKRNYWIVHEESKFAHWSADFPRGQMNNLWEQWAFAKEVLQAGQEEGVYRITSASQYPHNYGDYEEASGQSYNERTERILREHGMLAFFNDIGRCVATSRLCYYDLQGKVMEAEVDCPGMLLRQLRPDLEKSWKIQHYQSQDPNPIRLWGLGGRVWKREERPEWTDEEFEENKCLKVHLEIETATDIWFPKVWGYLEEVDREQTDEQGRIVFNEKGTLALRKPEWEDMSGWFDNRELAQCHTPRFNNFIQRVRQITLNYGGVCHLCDE